MAAATVSDRAEHILVAIASIRAYTADIASFEEFVANTLVRDAVECNIERISEASRRIPEWSKSQHPNVPWQRIAGIGNILRHDYEAVREEVIWRIVGKDLDPLEAAVRAIVGR